MKGKLLFSEVQRFRNTWGFHLTILISLFMIYQGVSKGIQNSNFLLTMLPAFIVVIAVIVLLLNLNLYVEIDAGYITYRHPPFVRQHTIGKQDVKELYVRRYDGGYRGFRKNKAYNVSGKIGLQIVFKDGRKLLLGTQKKEEMEKAISKLKENWGMS